MINNDYIFSLPGKQYFSLEIWRYVYIYFFKITTVTLTFEICVLEMKISPVQCEIMEFLQYS